MKTKELFEKRLNDFYETTEAILSRYQDELIRAIRLFTKTGRDIIIESIHPYAANRNFIVHNVRIELHVGDKIRDVDGNAIVITEENKDTVVTNDMNLLVPVKLLDDNPSAVKIYENLKTIDSFISEHGEEKFYKTLASGITSFDDILDEKHEALLEELTDPTDTILKQLDELQQVQYNLFIKDTNRKVH